MNLNMSYEMNLEILNAARKRNEMFAKWIELCSTIAFLLVSVVALINISELDRILFGENETIMDGISIFTVMLSISFDFIFKSDKYKENLIVINDIFKLSTDKVKFEEEFIKNISLIKEIDVARARNDVCINLKVHNLLEKQLDADKLQPVDLIAIDRARYIIISLIVEIILFFVLLIFLHKCHSLIYIVPTAMLMFGLIIMIIDANGSKKAEKTIKKLYYENEDK